MDIFIEAQRLAPILFAVAAGALVQGFSGFGFAIVAAPILGLFLPPATALPYVMAMQGVLGLSGLPGAFPFCRWRLLGWLGLGLVAGTPLGVIAITLMSPPLGRVMVALAACAALVMLMVARDRGREPRLLSILAAGLTSGVMNGIAGMSGPPAVVLVMGADLEARAVRATLLVFVFLAAVAALVPLGLEGRLTSALGKPLLAALPVLVGGWLLGSRGFRRTSARIHRTAILVIMGVLSLASLLRASLP
jgi:uncharacterized membrane protein YfcA